jgi:hypothetical protein
MRRVNDVAIPPSETWKKGLKTLNNNNKDT